MQSIVQAVFENSRVYPEKDAIIVGGKRITYMELTKKINAFAISLKKHKISRGSKIMIEADDLISYFCSFLACQLYGCIAVPIEKNISIYRLSDILRIVKPKLIFMKNNGEDYKEYLQTDEEARTNFAFPKEDSVCTIVGTTGTTGKPSLIVHTNRSMVATVENLCEGVCIDNNTVLFSNMPFNLASGYRRVFATLFKGGTAVITQKSLSDKSIHSFFEDNFNINHIALVSSDLLQLANLENAEKILSGIKQVESVTGELSPEIINAFYYKFPNSILYNVYGSTESGCILINNTREKFSSQCLGKPACNAHICLIDENGNKVTEPGKYGYVAVKGDMNMKEYYRKKELTEQVMNKDRLIVNDIVYFDEEGYYYFVSRVGDIINVQGHKVTPSGIEKVAMNYEGIADCACVAKDDVRYGQIPVLFVQYEEENNDTECESGGKTKDSTKEERLIEFLKNNLESYRVPKEIISIKKIPRTDTGKLMRKSLSMLTLK